MSSVIPFTSEERLDFGSHGAQLTALRDRQIRAFVLGKDLKQVNRVIAIEEVVDRPCAAPLALTTASNPDLAQTAAIGDEVADLRVLCDQPDDVSKLVFGQYFGCCL